MKPFRSALIACLAAAAFAPVALADDDDDDHDHRRQYRSEAVSAGDALDIAGQYGLGWIKEIKRGNGNWEIEGCTHDGQEIEIDISGRSGDIFKLEYEDDDAC